MLIFFQLLSKHILKQKFKPKNALFLLKNSKNRRALGAPPLEPCWPLVARRRSQIPAIVSRHKFGNAPDRYYVTKKVIKLTSQDFLFWALPNQNFWLRQ